MSSSIAFQDQRQAISIYDLDLESLQEVFLEWGEPAYRAVQVWSGLYQKLWSQPKQFSSLPQKIRDRLAERFEFQRLQPVSIQKSIDGETLKTLFTIPGGQSIEAVRMQYEKRRTLCISSQAGCAMGCVFCATGQMGFRRNLSSGEIVEQVIYYARLLAIQDERVSNVVVMGMGEPFHNYDATMAAIDRLNHPDGMNIGARRFTVSTVGLIPGIRRMALEKRQINLAISLHAADDELRASLLPVNHRYPIDALLEACREYVNLTHRRITFEWALIRDINDSPTQAKLLAHRLQPLVSGGAALCHVNVIPLNPTQKYAGQASPRERAAAFQDLLEQNGIPCTIRIRRGIDIQAGCGQLAAQPD